MKKQILMIIGFVMVTGLFLSSTVFAQQWTNGTGNDIYKTTMPGNVGIGLTAPGQDLHIYDATGPSNILLESNNDGSVNTTLGSFQVLSTLSGDRYFMGLRKWEGNVELLQTCYYSATSSWGEFVNVNYTTKKYEFRSGIIDAEFMNSGKILFNNTGAIGIGTGAVAIPTGVKLAVNGKINCKEVEVTLTGWSDHVFNSSYKLRPLEEVETFISQNQHLPDVPSEAEVLQNGANLGKMDAILLQKIEELTLYVIDLKKENNKLQEQINKLSK
jgi:hypothetical protein